MVVRFCSLASGSAGNATLVEVGRTRLMIDCGLGLAETCRRLQARGWEPGSIRAILVTHEHGDHIAGVARLAERYDIEVIGSHGSLIQIGERLGRLRSRGIDSSRPLQIDDALVEPFSVPHDAREPLQFVVGDGRLRLGVLTDTGCSTRHIEDCLRDCDGLVLECNHDRALLLGGPYPQSLKARVGGPLGHLDNQAAAELLARLDHRRLQHLVAAHLSEQNNRPELVRAALAVVLGERSGILQVATQAAGFDWCTLHFSSDRANQGV